MANFFNVTLDTTGPASPSLVIAGGATYATARLVNVAISTTDTPTTGYQMKIWGDLDLATAKSEGLVGGAATGTDEADALWITYTSTKQINLSSGDGSKTVNVKIRDDVYNESASASDSIILDTTLPVVTISGPDVSKISKQSGKNVASFTFSVAEAFVEYKVKVVAASGGAQTTGTQIPTTAGSTNMSGTGTFPAATPISCSINGSDLETASSGDGAKIIKVFVKDNSGNWSI